jgi:ferredoxin
MPKAVIRADRKLCQGYGNCSSNVPNLFGSDEEGLVVTLKPDLDEDEDIEQAELAVRSCPMSALALEYFGPALP